MWPWTHLAFGYLLVSLGWRLRGWRVTGVVAVAAAFGTQFPDLIDKPLAWYLTVLPAGRSLMHSVFMAAAVSAVVVAVAVHRDRLSPGLAFVVAYWSHLLGDALPKLPAGEYESLTFLLWPVLPLPEYEGSGPVVANLGEIIAAPATYLLASPLRLAAIAAVVLLWCADGFPGVADAIRYLSGKKRPRHD